jgi:tRNA threonylcarbamoyladenosine biosynthesis protein TsaB
MQAPGERVLAAIDARMGEIYLGGFIRYAEGLRLLGNEAVLKPDAAEVEIEGDGWHGVGSGFAAAGGALRARLHAQLTAVDAAALPHAADVARLAALAFARGEVVAPERAEPAYLRDNVALTLVQQQALRAAR